MDTLPCWASSRTREVKNGCIIPATSGVLKANEAEVMYPFVTQFEASRCGKGYAIICHHPSPCFGNSGYDRGCAAICLFYIPPP